MPATKGAATGTARGARVTGTDDDALAELLERARQAPAPEQVQAMADAALAKGSPDMSADEITALAHQAVAQAEQVVTLLRRLAAMAGERS